MFQEIFENNGPEWTDDAMQAYFEDYMKRVPTLTYVGEGEFADGEKVSVWELEEAKDHPPFGTYDFVIWAKD